MCVSILCSAVFMVAVKILEYLVDSEKLKKTQTSQ